MATILLEIGSEELPAEAIPDALAKFEKFAREQLAKSRLSYGSLNAWGTQRRIILFAEEVVEHQAPAIREVRGPSVNDAFAGNGEPTQAALGFARSQGMTIPELRIKQTENGEFLYAIFHDEGRPINELLPGIFLHLITSLRFPSMMHWGSGEFRFARPIRWIVAMIDDQVVQLSIDDVVSGCASRGHRFLSPDVVTISHASYYPRMMDESLVVVDPQRRRAEIISQLTAIAADYGAAILYDDKLLENTVHSVEYATALRVAIDSTVLSLPDEVLMHVLRSEQRFFPLAGANGKLLPQVLAVRNGDRAFLTSVRQGYESVARAKLLDALFFFEQDQLLPLASRLEALRGVVFQEPLGSMYDKARRMESLAGLFAGWLHYSADERKHAERAALLARVDMATAMVNEHPKLSGTMGMIYARLAEEDEAVALAIGQQYFPRYTEDAIPTSRLGKLVALADKVDTISACYAIGISLDGSEDPYGVSLHGHGVIRILTEADLALSLSQISTHALRQLPLDAGKDKMPALPDLLAFYRRIFDEMMQQSALSKQIRRAVLKIYADIPATAWRLAWYLREHQQDVNLQQLIKLTGRLEYIAKKTTVEAGNLQLLCEPAEMALFEQYSALKINADTALSSGRFLELQQILSSIIPAAERFFNEVTIQCENEELSQTRMQLAGKVRELLNLLGDLSLLSGV